ncbi:MAG: TerB family tellurite resistance protein [Cyanobacteria bacterium P01_A01_bin.17]
MNSEQQQHRLILQILVGSAWADQHLEPQEVSYLQTLLQRYHLSHDSELQSLLEAQVSPEQTERWIIAYLKNADEEERMILLAKIGKILIADDKVSDSEHDLLDRYYELMARTPHHAEAIPKLVNTLGRFVRDSIKTISELAER